IEITFPIKLQDYELNEDTLTALFDQVSSGETELQWSLNEVVPTCGFYKNLHQFLKKWPLTRRMTKSDIGRFYMAIDDRLCHSGVRPDNVYRFIETISKHDEDAPVKYLKSKQEISDPIQVVRDNAHDIQALNSEIKSLRKKLHSAQTSLEDVTNTAETYKLQRDCARRKATYYKSIQSTLLEDLAAVQEDYCDLSEEMAALQQELSAENKSITDVCFSDENFTIATKLGRKYSPAIRKLYYSLFAKAVPASQITDIVKTVVKAFNPSIDVEQIKLPTKPCASYMRKDEMKTVSAAHKATLLTEHAANKTGFKLNTDGTTKNLKKIGGVGINDIVISLNELPDGTADTAIADISHELEKLRTIAHELKIPNANSINWTMFVATNSDSAASQKKMNRLIEDYQATDQAKYETAKAATFDIIESFCSMHLAVNLRKAFLTGVSLDSASNADRYHPADLFVHEFCKLFGSYGVPEYGCGISFRDYLSIMTSDTNLDEDDLKYYHDCFEVTLERQIGSRYFVTAANAMKIIFLREAAIEFLKYTGREEGTKLEKEVYKKLIDDNQMALLKVDALIFYHVYSDLATLSKSNELNKSVLDMNHHYNELKLFLEEVEQVPAVMLRMNLQVFKEDRLYTSDNCKINHRCKVKSIKIHKKLFKECNSSLFQFLVSGVIRMKEKLCHYARSNLPGGIYWEPSDPQVRKVLSEVRPSNDFCESILGLNDHLTTSLPNLHQVARSTLVEVKKNKTVKWLDELPHDQQLTVIDMAVRKREAVNQETKLMSKRVASQRKERMIHTHKRHEAYKKKKELEKDRLSQTHLIVSSTELHEAIKEIDLKKISATRKRQETKMLLSNQIKLRKSLLKQDINIKFSHSGKQRPLGQVIEELSNYIDCNLHDLSPYICNPSALVGRRIKHKFIEETKEIEWYIGMVLDYDSDTKAHEVLYDGEVDHCFFDLTMDLLNGDLIIL
uniref:Uncharacterized protein n=1 Tax=Amphimedon queenslandica TaxID=400682 RepID=A0A1X7T216_AMPQE